MSSFLYCVFFCFLKRGKNGYNLAPFMGIDNIWKWLGLETYSAHIIDFNSSGYPLD